MDNTIVFAGANCHYRTEGKGKTVVLLHGFIEEGSMWTTTVNEMLKRGYKVIVPDLPGFGRSELVDAETPITMELYADYVYAILEQEKIKSCILLGHSMGGYVALHFAKKYDYLLKGFGLINSHCYEDPAAKKLNRQKGIDFVRRHGTAVFVKELYNSIFHPVFKRKNQKLINALITKAQHYTPQAVMRANEAMMRRPGNEHVLKNTSLPVLMINGKQDESAPIANTLKQASLPQIADVHFFDYCKHMCVFERTKETNRIIREFCERSF